MTPGYAKPEAGLSRRNPLCPGRPALAALLGLLLPALFLSSCAQWWPVRPHGDFVQVELRPGDRIRVETRDGRRAEMIVRGVTDDRIVSETGTILLSDISKLEKHSENPPSNPCSPQVPLGCSVPQWASVLHESQSKYEAFFYPSCEQHDYCYRHGAATYRKSRTECDEEFLTDMQEQCKPDNAWEALQLAGDYASCSAVAMEFYLAVRKYGADRFSTSASTYCEYDGPP